MNLSLAHLSEKNIVKLVVENWVFNLLSSQKTPRYQIRTGLDKNVYFNVVI